MCPEAKIVEGKSTENTKTERPAENALCIHSVQLPHMFMNIQSQGSADICKAKPKALLKIDSPAHTFFLKTTTEFHHGRERKTLRFPTCFCRI